MARSRPFGQAVLATEEPPDDTLLVLAVPGALANRLGKRLSLAAPSVARLTVLSAGFVDTLTPEQRARLVAVMGEEVLGLAPALGGRVRTGAMVADPADVVAFAYYGTKLRRADAGADELALLELLVTDPLERVFARFEGAEPGDGALERAWARFCNPQARLLLAQLGDAPELPFTAGPPPDAQRWRDALDAAVADVELAGVHTRALAKLLGAGEEEVQALEETDSDAGRSARELQPAAREAVVAYNWLDAELYARVALPAPPPVRAKTGKAARVRGRATTLDLFFDKRARAEGAPAVVVQDLPQSGGAAVLGILGRALEGTRHERHWVPMHAREHVDTLGEWYFDLVETGGPQGLAALRLAAGQSANFLLGLLDDAVALCVMREPAERLVAWHGRRQAMGSLEQFYDTYGGKRPGFGLGIAAWFNGQARALLAPELATDELAFTEGPPLDADRWREPLFAALDGYELGTADRFEETVERFAAAAAVPLDGPVALKAAPAPLAEDVEPALRERILDYNWLDEELYAEVSRRVSA